MDFAAVIVVVAALVGGAAVPFGIAWALERWWRRLPVRPLWLGLAGGLVGGVLGFGIVGDWFTGAAWNERVPVAQVLPAMGEIRKRDKGLYERLETSILRDQQDGKSADEVRANAKAMLMSYVADKTAFLPDDLTYELYAVMRDVLAYLAERREFEVCAGYGLGRLKEDVDPKLSSELVERSTATTLRVLAAPRDETVERMSGDQFAQLTAQAFAEASQATGIPPEDVEVLLSGAGDPAKTCRIMKAFFDAVLMQPVGVAAAALRTLSQGERSGFR
ncbi:MAG: hypothetical protein HOP13_12270 [Alphaproteobacteria bacterium]|nr:hypothetical protein [Alphaproteobacteria bacterium]